MRSFGKSEEAFRTVVQHSGTYVQEALNSIALRTCRGFQTTRFASAPGRNKSFPASNIMVGRSLFYIGAYPQAHCFAKQGVYIQIPVSSMWLA